MDGPFDRNHLRTLWYNEANERSRVAALYFALTFPFCAQKKSNAHTTRTPPGSDLSSLALALDRLPTEQSLFLKSRVIAANSLCVCGSGGAPPATRENPQQE